MKTIRYLGKKGSYSHEVAETIARNDAITQLDSYDTIQQVVSSPAGAAEGTIYCVVPLENSVSGDVYEAYWTLFQERHFAVVATAELQIQHVLFGLPTAKEADVTTIFSHTQALAQVTKFVQERKLQVQAAHSTSDAAARVSQANDPRFGVIASPTITKYYPNLVALNRQVSNHQYNYTRFLIIQKQAPQQGAPYLAYYTPTREGSPRVFSIFELPHDEAGGLMKVLEIFSQQGVNLTNIKSRPIEGKSFEYFFVIEGVMQQGDGAAVFATVEALLRTVTSRYVLSFY